MGSLPGAETRVGAGPGHDQEGKGPSADGGQDILTIQLPQPEEPGSMPAHGGLNDRERRQADIDGREVEQTHSHLHSIDVDVAEGSGFTEGNDIGREKVERLDPSPPTTSILRGDTPDST